MFTKAVTSTLLAVALAAASGASQRLQLSDYTIEQNDTHPVGYADLVKFTMPPECNGVTTLYYFVNTPGPFKAVLYDAGHVLVASRDFTAPGVQAWRDTPFYVPVASGSTFYVGVEWVTASTPGLGVDTSGGHYSYNWIRSAAGAWSLPADQNWNFMLGVEVDYVTAVAPASLGRVKAMWR